MNWISCKESLPPTPKNVTVEKEYLVCFEGGRISVLRWGGGWNCSVLFNGTIDREHEIKGIVAWAELPAPYMGDEDESE